MTREQLEAATLGLGYEAARLAAEAEDESDRQILLKAQEHLATAGLLIKGTTPKFRAELIAKALEARKAAQTP